MCEQKDYQNDHNNGDDNQGEGGDDHDNGGDYHDDDLHDRHSGGELFDLVADEEFQLTEGQVSDGDDGDRDHGTSLKSQQANRCWLQLVR